MRVVVGASRVGVLLLLVVGWAQGFAVPRRRFTMMAGGPPLTTASDRPDEPGGTAPPSGRAGPRRRRGRTVAFAARAPEEGGGFSLVESEVVVGDDQQRFEDAAYFSLSRETLDSWLRFSAAVATVLTALAVLWIRPDTGYSDDFEAAVVGLARGDPHVAMVLFGSIFATVHSGLAALRPTAEQVVGARAWRVLFACASLPLAYTWIVFFVAHRWDGVQLWDLHATPGIHALCWFTSFVSFLFLYPSTFNLKEVAAIDKPQLHLWGTGVTRITRHPQAAGQAMWSAAHLLWVGSSVAAVTMGLLVGHHAFSIWHGDRRLERQYGPLFDDLRNQTSVLPFAAIIDGRQQLPADYWKEWVRAPYAIVVVGTLAAYLAHPYMQAGAALVQNTGLVPGGLLNT